LGISQVALHVPGGFLSIENSEWPVGVVASLKKRCWIFDNGAIGISATKERLGSQPFNPGIAAAVISIRMSVDHKAQFSWVDSQIRETWPDQGVHMFGASGIQQESAIVANEKRQIQWPEADLSFE
jgi:hypothetical protein